MAKAKPNLKVVGDGSNGTLPILLTWPMARQRLEFIGGPFDAFKPGVNADFGLCVRAERVPKTADMIVPIKDFDIPRPEDRELIEEAIKLVLRQAMHGNRVWIGCMGGFGRTGLFLALLAKVAGHPSPVAYVRETYYPHAVETPEQFVYVHDFDVSGLRSWLMWASWGKFWGKALTWWIP